MIKLELPMPGWTKLLGLLCIGFICDKTDMKLFATKVAFWSDVVGTLVVYGAC